MPRETETERVQRLKRDHEKLELHFGQPAEAVVVGLPPQNGKRRWWSDVNGRVVSTVLGVVAIAILAWGWTQLSSAAAATRQLYRLDPRVMAVEVKTEDHEVRIKAIEDEQMPPGMAKRLDDFLKAQERKGKR